MCVKCRNQVHPGVLTKSNVELPRFDGQVLEVITPQVERRC